MEWEVFQMLILVASSSGGTQCVIRWLHGAKPAPWNILFNISNTANTMTNTLMKSGALVATVIQWLISALKPKMKLMMAQAANPIARCQRALERSAVIPLTNLETP